MASLIIDIPDQLDSAIAQAAQKDGAATSAQWVVAAVKAVLQSRADKTLEALLLEGINSGDATPMTQDDWSDLHRQLEEYIAGQSGRRNAA